MRRSADAAHMGQSSAERFRFSDHADVRGFPDGPVLVGWGRMLCDYADYGYSMSLPVARVPRLRNGSRIATVFGARPLAEAPPRSWRAELRGGAAWEGAQTGNRES